MLMALCIGLPRLLQPPIAQERLRSCQQPCMWDRVDIHGLSVGDLVAALGPPEFVSFSGVGRALGKIMPNVNYFREALLYPSLKLQVSIDNWEDALRIWPHMTRRIDLYFTNGRSLGALDWHGFATVCRYYPRLIDLCVKF